MVKGDGDRLKHLLAHLTSNAFKKSTVVKVDINLISTKDDTSVIGLRVQDCGPGMTEAELDVCPYHLQIITQITDDIRTRSKN